MLELRLDERVFVAAGLGRNYDGRNNPAHELTRISHIFLFPFRSGHVRPRQLWFVGKRLWHRSPNFAAFDLAKSSPVSISTIETLQSAHYAVGIALQMLNVGRNMFLGLITTSP